MKPLEEKTLMKPVDSSDSVHTICIDGSYEESGNVSARAWDKAFISENRLNHKLQSTINSFESIIISLNLSRYLKD